MMVHNPAEYYRKYRADRKARGLCPQCGKKNDTKKYCCTKCAKDKAIRSKKWYEKKKANK